MLDRIRDGDPAALAELLDEEWLGLVRYLTGICGAPDSAADAAQEAFVRLWERRERWSTGSARALLYRIGRNVVLDERRRRRVRDRMAPKVVVDSGAPESADSRVLQAEADARVRGAVRDLPDRRREVFELVRAHGLSYAEVAEVLDLAPQTVANHLSLALRDLRVALADLIDGDAEQNESRSETRSSDG